MSFYSKLIRPALFTLPPETAHELGLKALQIDIGLKYVARERPGDSTSDSFGDILRFGLKFSNPLGMAAGFDKNGIVVNQLAELGFGFVEVGTVTFHPQKGNPKPRMFRLQADQGLINRLGFNNHGAAEVAERLSKLNRKCIVGVNIGKNKEVPNEEATENYLSSFDLVHPVADYIAVNISSPNTPNLRELQKTDFLERLLSALQERNRGLSSKLSWPIAGERPTKVGTPNMKPLLVKIAPDLADREIKAIVDVCVQHRVDGIIATNTTISRTGLRTDFSKIGDGGLSGRPLAERSTGVISTIYRYSKGKLPIIGVGGIFNAEDAFAKIAAGASLIQAYTGFVYGGPSFAADIITGLARILKKRGFETFDQAIGTAAGG